MSARSVVLMVVTCALAYAPAAAAQEIETLFNARIDERRVIALSVRGEYDIGGLIDTLRAYAGPSTTLLAYAADEHLSETEPLVVYVDGVNVAFAERPRTSRVPPTFADAVQAATIVERGERNGAICRDGTHTDVTHNGACSFNGGVERWTYEAEARTDPRRVVAAICTDYRLVAGAGDRCDDADVLAPVMPLVYPEPEPAPPPSESDEAQVTSPTERPVAPLPEPALVAPEVQDSRVEWTERIAGRVGFSWAATLANRNAQPVRARVRVNLRDAAGEVIHTDERIIALDAGARTEFTNAGAVAEEAALRGQRWTFDVSLTDEAPTLTDEELASVQLVVDPLGEEATITNTSDGDLDLNGWTLTSTVGGESFTFRFFTLAAGATVVLTSGDGARSMLPRVYLWTAREVWDDDGDAAELRDAEGRLRARTHADGSAAALPRGGDRRAAR